MFDYREAPPEKRTQCLFGPGCLSPRGATSVSVHLAVYGPYSNSKGILGMQV